MEPMIYDLNELKDKAFCGDKLATYILGRSYFSAENGTKKDDNKAYKWYHYGAKKLNDARCIYGLGFCYEDGVGVEKDVQEAKQLFETALPLLKEQASSNNPYTKFILGAYYFYGLAGTEKDEKRAFELIYDAAMQGHVAAIYDIGTFYHNGVGVAVDNKKSKAYLELAAHAGLERAKDKLLEWNEEFKKI